MHSNVPDLGRVKAAESRLGAVLVLDEIQKVTDWSNTVKFLWDRDTRAKSRLKVVLLGSSPLLVQPRAFGECCGLSHFLFGKSETRCPPEVRFAVSPWRAPAANAGRGNLIPV